MKKLMLSLALLGATATPLAMTNANAMWTRDYQGYFVSNICRNGMYWQVVPWGFVGSECYLPAFGIWGKHVAE